VLITQRIFLLYFIRSSVRKQAVLECQLFSYTVKLFHRNKKFLTIKNCTRYLLIIIMLLFFK
jgi:hypothetical protein